MEIAIPLIALGSLYVVTNQKKKYNESFVSELPNTNIPNKNYPSEYPVVWGETDQTSKLSHDNRYDGGAFTDKFFNANMDDSLLKKNNEKNADNKYMSITGKAVDGSYFQHNNMVPFFGGNMRTRHTDNNSNESVMDNYIGSGSQQIHKTEQSPLFLPQTNMQWANGMPSYSDFEQSRMNVSNKMSNVNPFAEKKVAPGLGLGAGTEGMGGFNSGMLSRESWMDRNVDQLRVESKPKASGLNSLGREGPAISFITKQGNIGQQDKNRPDTTFDMGPERYFKTTGIEQKPVLIPIPIEKYVSRPETSTAYEGGAGFTHAEYVPGEYMPSHNHHLKSVNMGPADAGGKSVANENDYAIKSNRAYNNSRSSNQQNAYFGSAGKGIIAETIAPLLDVLRPSRKENSVGTLRPYQNAKTAVTQSYIFNPADKPLPTIKETTVNSKFHLNVNSGQRGGGYEVNPQQPIHNARDYTTNYSYIGNSSASERARQPMSYESGYNQHNNDVKSSTVAGYATQGNMSLFNGQQNVRQSANNEQMYDVTKRALVPTLSSNGAVSMGEYQAKVNPYSGMQLDRNNGDVLSQLSGNPFVQNINKYSESLVR